MTDAERNRWLAFYDEYPDIDEPFDTVGAWIEDREIEVSGRSNQAPGIFNVNSWAIGSTIDGKPIASGEFAPITVQSGDVITFTINVTVT